MKIPMKHMKQQKITLLKVMIKKIIYIPNIVQTIDQSPNSDTITIINS